MPCRNANITCQMGEPKYSFVGEGDPNTDDPLVYVSVRSSFWYIHADIRPNISLCKGD